MMDDFCNKTNEENRKLEAGQKVLDEIASGNIQLGTRDGDLLLCVRSPGGETGMIVGKLVLQAEVLAALDVD
jgi:hypothetical protein